MARSLPVARGDEVVVRGAREAGGDDTNGGNARASACRTTPLACSERIPAATGVVTSPAVPNVGSSRPSSPYRPRTKFALLPVPSYDQPASTILPSAAMAIAWTSSQFAGLTAVMV